MASLEPIEKQILRQAAVIGIAVLLGMTIEAMPGMASVAGWLTAAVFIGLSLALLERILLDGIEHRKQKRMASRATASPAMIDDFLRTPGKVQELPDRAMLDPASGYTAPDRLH